MFYLQTAYSWIIFFKSIMTNCLFTGLFNPSYLMTLLIYLDLHIILVFPQVYWHITLYKFKMYNVMTWYKYVLWNDYHIRLVNTSFQFSSVQLLSHVRLFATPWITACQASLSITNSRSLLKLMSIESDVPSSHLILCRPLLLLLPIPPFT